MKQIEIIPAIDLIDGKCVRLTKGDYTRSTVYSGAPADIARHFEELGARRLHVVDLDGAKASHIVNERALREIAAATMLTIDFGGGIKTDEDMRRAFCSGAEMVTVGSVAVTDRDMMCRWIDTFGASRIILGADVYGGKIRVNGWKEDSGEDVMPFLEYYVDRGITNVLCTDISRDGTLQGPSIELYRSIVRRFPTLHLIASGGVSSMEDIRSLQLAGVPAVVFGKAFYEGKITEEELRDGLNKTYA